MKKVTIINNRWTKADRSFCCVPTKPYDFRQHQQAGFEKLLDATLRLMKAPMGSGKTLLMLLLAHSDITRNLVDKVIVAVPQIAIGDNYNERVHVRVNGKEIFFIPETNFRFNTVNHLRLFLERAGSSVSDRIQICSHQTLAQFFKRLTSRQKQRFFGKVGLWIDETHHLRWTEYEFGEAEPNELGKVVKWFLDNKKRVGLATGTYMRGDYHSIIEREYEEQFTTHTVSMADYMTEKNSKGKSVRMLKTFSYDFLICDRDDCLDGITSVFKNKFEPTVVYLSSDVCGESSQKKREEIEKLIRAMNPDKRFEIGKESKTQPYYTLQIKGRKRRIYQLVVGSQRAIAKKTIYIRKSGKSKNPNVDVIIALRRFVEGVDYVPLAREIIIGNHSSCTFVAQMAGRPLRDYPKKSHAAVYHLLPSVVGYSNWDKGKLREGLNSYLKGILIVMAISEFFFPPKLVKIRCKKTGKVKRMKNDRDRWFDYFGSSSVDVKLQILHDLIREMPDKGSKQKKWKVFEKLANRQLVASVKDKDHCEEMIASLKVMFGHHILPPRNWVDTSEIDLGLLEEKCDPSDFLRRYISPMIGTKTWRELKEKCWILTSRKLTLDELKKEVQSKRIRGGKEYLEKREQYGWTYAPHNLKGWISWYDFLGKKKSRLRQLTLDELKKEVQSKRIKSQREYHGKRKQYGWTYAPHNLKGWISWYDFLGKKKSRLRQLTLDELKKEVQSKGIKSQREYHGKREQHNWIPMPQKLEGWISWYDFLGKKKSRLRQLTLDELKKEVQSKGIKTSKEYHRKRKQYGWTSMPHNLKGWISWYDFLGKKKTRQLTLDELKKEVQSKGIRSGKKYREKRKQYGWTPMPGRLKGWVSWYDFLGKKKSRQLTLDELEKEVQSKGIKTSKEYREKGKKYGWTSNLCGLKGWVSWYDFLGKKKKSRQLTLDELEKEVQSKGIKTSKEYREKGKKYGWTSNPDKQKGWVSWYDFLGKKKTRQLTLDELKKEVQSKGIKSFAEFKKKRKQYGWQCEPQKLEGWISWYDFFGKERPA